jgi:hypothetical protein
VFRVSSNTKNLVFQLEQDLLLKHASGTAHISKLILGGWTPRRSNTTMTAL